LLYLYIQNIRSILVLSLFDTYFFARPHSWGCVSIIIGLIASVHVRSYPYLSRVSPILPTPSLVCLLSCLHLSLTLRRYVSTFFLPVSFAHYVP
jgi:hypothetical protein